MPRVDILYVHTGVRPDLARAAVDLGAKGLVIAGSGAGSSLSILPTVFNHVLGTKFRLILGYKGTTDVVLAIERGEVQGACASYGQFRIYDRRIDRTPAVGAFVGSLRRVASPVRS